MKERSGFSGHPMRQWFVPFAMYLVATGAALLLIRADGRGILARLGVAALFAAATFGAAAVTENVAYSRATLMSAATILAAATVVVAALSSEAGDVINSGWLAWFTVWLIGISPARGSGWCRSEGAIVAGSSLVGLLLVAAEVLSWKL